MNRVIVMGRNDQLPRNAVSRQLRICGACEGTGHEWAYYTINPSERPHKEPCSACDGEGAFEVESEITYTGRKPASGGAAVLRFPTNQAEHTARAQQAQPPLSPAAGLLALAVDVFTTLAGLATFLAVGFFFWVLA